jgi:hypothetical protein
MLASLEDRYRPLDKHCWWQPPSFWRAQLSQQTRFSIRRKPILHRLTYRRARTVMTLAEPTTATTGNLSFVDQFNGTVTTEDVDDSQSFPVAGRINVGWFRCNHGGPYMAECGGPATTTLTLNGSGVTRSRQQHSFVQLESWLCWRDRHRGNAVSAVPWFGNLPGNVRRG